MLFIAAAFIAKAQIPNNGFESWTTVGSYENPTGVWKTPNSTCTGPFYPVTKSTDHFPASVGSYSIRIENNTALLPAIGGCGIVLTNLTTLMDGPDHSFPISGHPNNFCGWYKFNSVNYDTMMISLQLYQGGISVAYANFMTIFSTSGWNSFNIPISTYTAADSGAIMISAYNADGPPPDYLPNGNSVLYVDNLSLDALITSAPDEVSENISFDIYPNPASEIVNMNINNRSNEEMEINIYDVIGNLVKSMALKQNQTAINIEDLSNGVYVVSLKSKDITTNRKLIIQR